jgi:cytochrome d ubiquinol oxidase subunit I
MVLGEAVTLLASGDRPPGPLPARQQMAVSCFGVAFPAMIFVMHRRGIVANDPTALRLAKRWSKASAVLFAIGAVSGTVLSFEMGLLWPGLMGRFGDVLGLPFGFEGLSSSPRRSSSESISTDGAACRRGCTWRCLSRWRCRVSSSRRP